MSIVLIGFMGAGKTTVAQTLAKTYSLDFADTDLQLGRQFAQPAGDLLRRVGEDQFREYEYQVMQQMLADATLIIATGGGIIESPASRVLLQQEKKVIWLNVDYQTCWSRIAGDQTRPLATKLSSSELQERFKVRQKYYRQVADLEISATKKSPQQLAQEIWRLTNIRD